MLILVGQRFFSASAGIIRSTGTGNVKSMRGDVSKAIVSAAGLGPRLLPTVRVTPMKFDTGNKLEGLKVNIKVAVRQPEIGGRRANAYERFRTGALIKIVGDPREDDLTGAASPKLETVLASPNFDTGVECAS